MTTADAQRRTLTSTTVVAVAAEMVGRPVDDGTAALYAFGIERTLQAVRALRAVPLKDVEPACLFTPGRSGSDD